ncbi:MAG: hypothetical protein AAF557_17310 [Pseudomonadota bacterium]
MSGLGFARIFGVLAIAILAGCAPPPPKPGQAVVPDGATVTHRAVFIGESNHSTVGTISLYQSEQDPVIVFEPNFDLPDPPKSVTVVALGRNGYRSETILGALLRPTGRQAYSVPGRLGIEGYNEVWLWSLSGDRPVGLARLTPLL